MNLQYSLGDTDKNLSQELIESILKTGISKAQLSKDVNVTITTINNILRKKNIKPRHQLFSKLLTYNLYLQKATKEENLIN